MATDYPGKSITNATVPSSTTARMGQNVSDADGNEYIYCYAPGVLAANTPYIIQDTETATTDPKLVALADGAWRYYVGVLDQATTTGDRVFAKIKGDATVAVTSATYTVSYGLKVHDGAVAVNGTSDAASHLSDNTFAIVKTSQTTAASTACSVRLLGRRALATT
jgi:hypothetical protein